MTASRETLLVELVDKSGAPVGTATVGAAHTTPGRLHRAFSAFLIDSQGRILLQQRAATKTRFPLRWANTCCGHPLPGQDPADAAARRLFEEVGVAGVRLAEVGVYSYFAEDAATGQVEYEYDHVLVGELPAGRTVRPDPAEVVAVRWATAPELQAALTAERASFAPWVAGVSRRLFDHLAIGEPTDAEPSGGR